MIQYLFEGPVIDIKTSWGLKRRSVILLDSYINKETHPAAGLLKYPKALVSELTRERGEFEAREIALLPPDLSKTND